MSNQKKLRSHDWFGRSDKMGFVHRSWFRTQGYPDDYFQNKPVIGICNTWSELTPCNSHFRDLAERVKRGVYEAGGFPLEFPVFSTGESNLRPTAMLFRNLASMDVEEAIRGNPIDGVVLMTGCDKTTPALLMGAASCDVPAIVLSGGPMLNGKYRGKDIGSGTDVWRFAEMVKADLRISKILKRENFLNAVRANGALGGSSNAVIHLIAIAGRVPGLRFSLDDWDRYGREVPTLVDIMPSGRFLMEDYYYAGGLPAVMRALWGHGMLDKDALTVTGQTMWENVKDAPNWDTEVIRAWDNPHTREGGMVILRGNLAPDGAVLKPSAATPALMKHRGRAVVFESIEDYKAKIADEALDVDETCVLVLKNCGPKGYPGMAEVGNMGLPPKVLRKGVRDMVRISDARMSGTAYGTVVLHVCPEAAAGGNLALVENGDVIELDVEARRLHLEIDEDELARRRAAWSPPEPAMKSGYQKLYVDHVMQASDGADLDFLRGCRGAG